MAVLGGARAPSRRRGSSCRRRPSRCRAARAPSRPPRRVAGRAKRTTSEGPSSFAPASESGANRRGSMSRRRRRPRRDHELVVDLGDVEPRRVGARERHDRQVALAVAREAHARRAREQRVGLDVREEPRAVLGEPREAGDLVRRERRGEHRQRREQLLDLAAAVLLEAPPLAEEGLLARRPSGSRRFITTASQGTSKSESSVQARRASSITMRSGVTTSRTLVRRVRDALLEAVAAGRRAALRVAEHLASRAAASRRDGARAASPPRRPRGRAGSSTRSARCATSGSVTRRSVESVGAQSTTIRS